MQTVEAFFKKLSFIFLHFTVGLSGIALSDTYREEKTWDTDGFDSPGNGASLFRLSVSLSELSGKLKCQSQILAQPVYTVPHSSASRGLATYYMLYVWVDSGASTKIELADVTVVWLLDDDMQKS